MPDGGRLEVACVARSARIAPEGDEKRFVAVRVADNGSGMSPEVLAKAVEPFFTTHERGKGSGLGLAQVHGFVRQCGGDLVIESAPGRGTVVEMLLPETDAPAVVEPPVRRAPPPAPSEPRRGKLLVVDDDDAVRVVVAELLERTGYEVQQGAGGAAALALLDTFVPDATVFDFRMPGMDGAELARQAQRRLPRLPIVFLSGYSETVALEGISGAVVLRKPLQVDALERAVESALSEPVP